MPTKATTVKIENIAIINEKERILIKEKMKNVVLQNPKVRSVFKRLKDK